MKKTLLATSCFIAFIVGICAADPINFSEREKIAFQIGYNAHKIELLQAQITELQSVNKQLIAAYTSPTLTVAKTTGTLTSGGKHK